MRHPLHDVWRGMLARCHSPRHDRYKDYGGRGIRVCDRWKDSFQAFVDDMGPRPSQEHQLDRRDNDGNYEPGNCQWVTREANARNRRDTLILTVGGIARPAIEWSEQGDMTYAVARDKARVEQWRNKIAASQPTVDRDRRQALEKWKAMAARDNARHPHPAKEPQHDRQ